MEHDDEELEESDAVKKEPPYAPQKDDEVEGEKPRRRKRRRRRRNLDIMKSDEPSTPFTLQQGWLDGIFAGPNLIILLAFTFFCFPVMFFVAIFAAITASDPEARRNALAVIGFCLAPVLLIACVGCIGKAFHPS
jgi:hypothetical protein